MYYCGEFLGLFEILVYGDYNVLNVLSVIVFCDYEGLLVEDVKKELKIFEGVKRRFSIIEKVN